MQRFSQNYPNIMSAQCRSSWQVPLAHAQHLTGTAWLFLAQDPRPVLCWLGTTMFLLTTVLFPLSSPSFRQKSLGDAP